MSQHDATTDRAPGRAPAAPAKGGSAPSLEPSPALDLGVQLGGLRLKNPVLTASGTCGYGEVYGDLIDYNRLGGLMLKGTYLEPKLGNPPPRIVETPAGMLNSIGLQGVGVEAFLRDKLPALRRLDTAIILNINGSTVDEFAELAARLNGVAGLHALEVNISCPNVKVGGMEFGVDPRAAREVTEAVCRASELPVIVKLTPNVTDITVIARAVEDGGAAALSVINTLRAMSIDVRTRRPKLASITGGLSGPAIRPVAVRMVWETARAVRIPIIGMGGITTAEDALEFLIAGASAVRTASFHNPNAPLAVLEGIGAYLREQGMSSLAQLVGSLKMG